MLRTDKQVRVEPGRPPAYCSVDTETTGLNVYRGDRPFCCSVSFPSGQSYFWRWDPDTFEFAKGPEQADPEMLPRILADASVDKVMHNAKFDIKMLRAAGMPVEGRVWDTGTLCHLLDGRNAEGDRLSLDSLTKKYLPNEPPKVTKPIDDYFASVPKEMRNFMHLPSKLLYERNMGDTVLTRKLFERVFTTVNNAFPYLNDMERRLMPIVLQAEDRGLLTDPSEAAAQIRFLQDIIEDVELFAMGMLDWGDWNINSNDHQAALLKASGVYDRITTFTKPKKDRTSKKPFVPRRKLDSRTLLDLHSPAAYMLLAGKAAAKMISPFLTSVLEDAINGVIHPSYLQNGTVGSRFSCRGPNLQNIPVEGDRKAQYTESEDAEVWQYTDWRVGQHIKRVFCCRPGFCHIHVDKKQAEMFALGHYTRDRALIEILNSGQSVHDGMCLKLFGEITKGLKQRSKAVTFGYQYGAGIDTTAKKAMCDIAEARRIRAKLGSLFSQLDPWKQRLALEIAQRGYVSTDTGRRYYLRQDESYMAVNRICQGHVGDELKGRMVDIGEYFIVHGFTDCRILMNIHDELAVECPIVQLPVVGPLVYKLMLDSHVEHVVPIPSDLEVTFTRWADLKLVENPHLAESYVELIKQFQEGTLVKEHEAYA